MSAKRHEHRCGWIALAIAALATSVASAAPAGRDAAWQAVETLGPSRATAGFTLTVEARAGDENSPRLTVTGPRGRTLRVNAEDGLVTVSDGLVGRSVPVGRRLHSRYVLASGRLATATGEPLLIVFGHPNGNDPGAIRVIALGRDGVARPVLSLAAFDLTGVEPAPGGGVDLVGVRSLSEMMDKCRMTYDPLAVYRFVGAAPGHFQYDLAMSRTYTVSHLGGWAGPASRDDVAVDECDHSGGRPGTLVRLGRRPKG